MLEYSYCIIFFILTIFRTSKCKNLVRYSGGWIYVNGYWYVFYFYLISMMTGIPETNYITSAVLFIVMLGTKRCFFNPYLYKTFMVWMVLMVLWYVSNLTRSTNLLYGINQVMKLIIPILIFIFAYNGFNSKESILLFFEKISKMSRVYMGVCLFCFLTGSLYFYPYYGIETIVFPLGLYLIRRNRIYLIMCLSCLSFLLCYVKRTCLLGLLCMCIIYCIYKYRIKALVPIVLLCVLFLLVIAYVPGIRNRVFIEGVDIDLLALFSADTYDLINSNGRNSVWQTLLEKFYVGNELIGSGTGNVKSWLVSSDNWYREHFMRVHNDWLQILCESGLIGVSLLSLMFINMYRKTYITYHSSNVPFTRMISIVMAMSITVTIIHLFFENCMGVVGFSMPAFCAAIYFRSLEFEKTIN